MSAILHGRVVLGGSEKQLSSLGLSKEIGFRDIGLFEQNQELISLMLRLRELGLVFSYDYKTSMSPSDFMQLLQDISILTDEFKEIAWENPNEWFFTTYEMEENT